MARHSNPVCRQCAKLSTEEAQKRDCWVNTCKQKRYYHQNHSVINHVRKQQRRASSDVISVPMPEIEEVSRTPVVTPIAIYYRDSKESSVHAVSAELRVNGKRFMRTEVKHCKGETESQIADWFRTALQEFSRLYGKDVGKYIKGGSVEFKPSECPLCRDTQ